MPHQGDRHIHEGHQVEESRGVEEELGVEVTAGDAERLAGDHSFVGIEVGERQAPGDAVQAQIQGVREDAAERETVPGDGRSQMPDKATCR